MRMFFHRKKKTVKNSRRRFSTLSSSSPSSSSYTSTLFGREIKVLDRVQQLFPFRSSIVKNENATEKGMTKKSWKHFSHTTPEDPKTPSRSGAPTTTREEIFCSVVVAALAPSWHDVFVRPEWGCFTALCLMFVSKQRRPACVSVFYARSFFFFCLINSRINKCCTTDCSTALDYVVGITPIDREEFKLDGRARVCACCAPEESPGSTIT